MPVINRRRRVQADDAEVPEPEPQPTQTQRLQATQYSDDEEPDSYMEGDEDETQVENSNIVPLARKLVRYALSCEYSRTQIRRTDIAVKGRQPSEHEICRSANQPMQSWEPEAANSSRSSMKPS